jgi:PTS system nitrogen regulatory IIA component
MEYKDDEIMTVAEVAAYLKLSEKTIIAMANKNEIPAAKIASQWRFRRRIIDDWLAARMKVLPQTDLARLVESGSDILPISRIAAEDFIIMDLRPGSKEEVLRQMVRPMVRIGIVSSEEAMVEKLMTREMMTSTALGRGVAIPHLRHPEENQAGQPDLIVGICREGTDFGSIDHQKTHLFFLLCTDSEVVHIRIMSKLASIFRQEDVVTRLIHSKTKEEVMSLLIEADQKMLMI